MRKRLFAVFTAVIIAVAYVPVLYAAGTITINEPKFGNGKITVTASVDASNRDYTMFVVSKGGDPKNLNERYGMGEEISDADKIVSFTFKMPETREILKSETNPNGYTDGDYTIIIRGKGTDKAEKDFYFATEGMKSAVADMILKSSEAELRGYFEKNSSYRNTFINMGFDFSEYDEQSSEIKSKIVSEFSSKMADYKDNLSELFNSAVKLVVMSKDAEAVIAQLEKGGYEFEGVKYEELEQDVKDWIVMSYLEHGRFEDIDEFEKMYGIANMLYIINKSKFHEVEGKLENYADALGITDSSEYKQYKSLASDDRLATDETLVNNLSKRPARTVKSLLSAISDSKTKASKGSGRDYESKVDTGFTAVVDGTVGDITAFEKNVFSDLGSVSWAKDAIKYLYDRKIISGVGDGKFDPNGIITREQFATIVVNALGIYDGTAVSGFTDVESGAWYEKSVASAQKSGIINGTDNDTFGVGNAVTRQDVAVIIARCAVQMGLQLENTSDELFNDDSDIAEYAKESVYTLASEGIINGVGDNMFAPGGNCTRAQAARLVYLLLTYADGDMEGAGKVPADIVSKFGFLRGLGMFGGATADMINMDAPILKGKFIQNAMRLVCGEEVPDSQLLETAKAYGIGASSDYDYDSKMSFDEAVAIVVQLSTMGTGSSINESAVQNYKGSIVRGTTETESEPISQGSVINLLYNAAKYEGIMTLTDVSDRGSYSYSDNTILEAKRNITKVVGIVTDNEMTSLSGASTVGAGEVKIDSVVALEGTSGAGQFLGKKVEAYICFGDDENKVIYLEDKGKTPELIIPAEKLDDVNTSNRTIVYESGNKTKTAKYSSVLRFIKNGKYYPGYDKEDFEITNGTIRLVDNDGDSVYDVIFVEKYTHIIVNAVLTYKSSVSNKYNTPDVFDFSEYDNYTIMFNGEKTDVSQIKQGDVLTILSTGKGVDGIATAYLTRKTVTGTVDRLSSEDEVISVDGVEYRLSDVYKKAGEAEDDEYTEVKLGGVYDFYLDYFGEIVYVTKSESADEYSYVYALKLTDDSDSGDNEYYLKYFTLNSTWERKALADRVVFNGTSEKKEVVTKSISGLFPEVFKIKVNKEGEISAIQTPVVTTDTEVFNKISVSGTWSVNLFGLVDTTKGGGVQMIFDDATKVFLVPVSGEEREYSIGNKWRFSSDRGYTITGYGFDEYKTADVTVYSKDTAVSSGSTLFLVGDKFDTVVNEEGATVLQGSSENSQDYTAVPTKPGLFSGVEKGDLIGYSTNELDEVENYIKLWGLSDYGKKMTPKQWDSANEQYVDSEFNKGAVFASGFVKDIDYKRMKMIVDTGAADNHVFNGKNDVVIPKVLIYDRDEETTELTDMSGIIPGDFVFMRFSWTRLQVAYVIR